MFSAVLAGLTLAANTDPAEVLAQWQGRVESFGHFVSAEESAAMGARVLGLGDDPVRVSWELYEGQRRSDAGDVDGALLILGQATARADRIAARGKEQSLSLSARISVCGVLRAHGRADGALGCGLDLVGVAAAQGAYPAAALGVVFAATGHSLSGVNGAALVEVAKEADAALCTDPVYAAHPAGHPEALLALLTDAASIFADAGDAEAGIAALAAAGSFASALGDEAGRSEALVSISRLALGVGDADLAGAAVESSGTPQTGWARTARLRVQAHLLALRGRLDEAAALAMKVGDIAAQSLAADIELLAGRPAEAARRHGELALRVPKELQWTERVEEAHAATLAGDPAWAERALSAIDPTTPDGAPAALAVRHRVVAARVAADKGELQRAFTLLAEAGPFLLALGDASALAQLGVEYGRVAERAKDLDAARVAYDHAIRFEEEVGLGPTGLVARFGRAAFRARRGDLDGAWADFREATARVPAELVCSALLPDASGRPALVPWPWVEAGESLGLALRAAGRLAELPALAAELERLDLLGAVAYDTDALRHVLGLDAAQADALRWARDALVRHSLGPRGERHDASGTELSDALRAALAPHRMEPLPTPRIAALALPVRWGGGVLRQDLGGRWSVARAARSALHRASQSGLLALLPRDERGVPTLDGTLVDVVNPASFGGRSHAIQSGSQSNAEPLFRSILLDDRPAGDADLWIDLADVMTLPEFQVERMRPPTSLDVAMRLRRAPRGTLVRLR